MNKEQLLQKYKNLGFRYYEMEQIELAINNGLSEEDIDIFANPKSDFDYEQMRELRLLLEDNKRAKQKLTDEQINFITNPDLKWYEMKLIRLCYEIDASQNEVEELLNTKFDTYQLEEINKGLEHGLLLEDIKSYATLEYSWDEMREKREYIEDWYQEQERIQEEEMMMEEDYKYMMKEDTTFELTKILHNYNIPQNEIETLLNENFNIDQIREIEKGFKNGLSLENIKIYAKPEYYYEDMEQIRLLLEYNQTAEVKLTDKQINFITNSNLNDYERQIIRLCYEKNIPQDKIEELLNEGFYFDILTEIIEGLNHNLTIDQIKSYAFASINTHEMMLDRLIIEGKLTQDDKFKILNSNLDEYQISQIGIGIEAGLTLDEVKIYAKPEFSWKQMFEIRKLLEYNLTADQKLTEEQIQFIANPDLEDYEMNFIRLCYEKNIHLNDIKELMNKNIDEWQLRQIKTAIKNNLSSDEIKFIATSNLNWYEMALARSCYENNVPQNEIDDLLDLNLDADRLIEIYKGLNNGLTIEEIKIYANYIYNVDQIYEIRLLLEYNLTAEPKLTEEQIQFITNPNLNADEMQLIRVCYENNIPQNKIEELLNKDFDENQIEEIVRGLENGLTIDEVKIYAKSNLYFDQMEQIRLGLEHQLTEEQIKIIANPDLQRYESLLIRICYEYNVPQNEIDDLLSKKFDEWETWEIVAGLKNGLTIDEIKTYASPEYTHNQMERKREQLEQEHEQNKLFEEIVNPETEQTEPIEISDNKSLKEIMDAQPADIEKTTGNGPTTDDGHNKNKPKVNGHEL